MTTAYDVPAKDLIDALTKKLQKEKDIVPPEWSDYVRTSISRENPPEKKDWWYRRCASILRKIYINNGIGTERLRSEYGGKQDRGSKPYKARSGSGSIIRNALHQLEKAGFVTKLRGKGRVLTSKGRSFLDNTAYEVTKNLKDYYPDLKKY
ncbi:MAG: 30S ribosomal protein S19e [Thermoplasmatales archaeon]|nr:MAG: 30S ribosomal protein S19e [Thermoplasmatales archaeon]